MPDPAPGRVTSGDPCATSPPPPARRLVAHVGAATPATAGPPSFDPAAHCRAHDEPLTNPVTGATYDQYVIPVEFSFGGATVVEDFGLATFQARVSTVASAMTDEGVVPGAELTTPTYLAQCDLLEAFGVVTYPYSFYGLYPAENRADCARILKGVHTGALPLPEEPPVG